VFRILRDANGEIVLTLIGRFNRENLPELKSIVASDSNGSRIILDLKDVTLIDREIVSYLGQCEENNIKLKNCPAYIREWIDGNRKQESRRKK
jgi:ABC-type transporter Mla MlaB component